MLSKMFPTKEVFFQGFSVGDEGKGGIFSAVIPLYRCLNLDIVVVRCNGGSQAGNSIMTYDENKNEVKIASVFKKIIFNSNVSSDRYINTFKYVIIIKDT